MSRPLRVLLVEDSEDDALLLSRELRRSGYNPMLHRVDTKQSMASALDQQVWDIVISDYVMPNFSAPAALDLLKQSGHDVPFIIVSGAVGEESAVAAMRTGAHDYVMKGQLARLVPAIERELHEASNRRERRRVEEISARLGRILDSSSNEIYVFDTTTLRLLQANQGACQNLGYSMKELALLTPLDLSPDLSPVDLNDLLAPLRSGEREQVVFETTQRRKDGSLYPVEVRLHLSRAESPPVFVAIALDISERRRASQRMSFLAESSALLASSLDYEHTLGRLATLCVPLLADLCAIYVVGPDRMFSRIALHCSDSLPDWQATALGALFQPEQVPALVMAALTSGQSQLSQPLVWEQPGSQLASAPASPALIEQQLGQVAALVSAKLAGQQLGQAAALEGPEPGAAAPLHQPASAAIMATPLIVRERQLGALVFVAVQPERSYGPAEIELANELARRAAVAVDNAQLYHDARYALLARDQFLSIAAHELKTPITALLGYSQLIERRARREGTLSQRDAQALHALSEQASRLHKLINSLLDLSRIQTGQLMIECQRFDLAALVRRLVSELQLTLNAHTLALSIPETSLEIEGDELRLEQVLQNLLQNAIKYSPHGGLISVRLEQAGDNALLAVCDQGMGIPEESLPRLFSRFYRAKNVDPDQIAGMGLGLYVVKEIVELHHGKVLVESTVGQGSTFTLRLPLRQPISTDAEANQKQEA